MKPILKTIISKEELTQWISEGKTLQDAVDIAQERSGYSYSTGAASKLAKNYDIKMPRSGPRSGELHKNWRGGRIINKDGYVEIYSPNHPNRKKHTHYILEHRLVIEEHLGRTLLRTEVVHHVNGDKQDNRIENLELFGSNAEHLAETLKGKCPNWSEDGKRRMMDAHIDSTRKLNLSEDEKRSRSLRIQLMNAIRKVLQIDEQPNSETTRHYLESVQITRQEALDMVARQEPLPLPA
jgi:hypothetical protein